MLGPVDRANPSERFFQACARGELIVQGCATCGHRQFYPRLWCLNCESTDLGWVSVSGRGELITYSIVRRAPSRAHKHRVPYAIGIVKLPEGPQLMASIVDIDLGALVPGLAVQIVASDEAGPCFKPAAGAAT